MSRDPQLSFDDTIVARATSPGEAAVAVVRLSGPEAKRILNTMAGPVPPAHMVRLRTVADAKGDPLDQALVVYMPAPNSYTGDDVVEFQLHGSPVIVRAVHERCMALGARSAGPGEFTQRAFLRGKLDLAQAEAVADVIRAANESEASAALRQLGGQLSHAIAAVMDPLEQVVSDWRAALDFPEYPTEEGASRERETTLRGAMDRLDGLLRRLRLRAQGARSVVLCGPPNAGKSTLVNRWVGEERVLVHDAPGTTRDPIEVAVDDGRTRFSLWDTAGIHTTSEDVESRGIEMAWRRIRDADFALWLVPADSPRWPDADWRWPVVFSKCDCTSGLDGLREEARRRGFDVAAEVSAVRGDGIDKLRCAVDARLERAIDDGVFVVRERQLEALHEARRSVKDTLDGLATGVTLDVLTGLLEGAVHALGRVLGRDVEAQLLDRIFRDFCIGK